MLTIYENALARTSACCRTFFTDSACRSGGKPCFFKIRLMVIRMRRLCPIDVSLAVARLVALAIGSFGCQNSYELTGESRMRSFSWN